MGVLEYNKLVDIEKSRTFDYKKMPYYVVAFYKDTLYGINPMGMKQLFKSTDGGKTWGELLYTFDTACMNGVLTSQGDAVFFLTNGDVYHTDDDTTFTKTLTDSVPPHNSGAGIAVNGQKIMFCEYTTTNDIDIHVHYSSDGGATWSVVMTKHTGTDIRHFHSLDYIVERDRWIVTSGDSDEHTYWWISNNNGSTWTVKAQGHQMFRTLGLDMYGQESFIWGSDSSNYHNIYSINGKGGEVFKSDMAWPHTYNVATLNSQCYGFAGHKDVYVAIEKVEAASFGGVYSSTVLISHDRGASWKKEMQVFTDSDSGGIIGVVGPDRYGRFYLYLLSVNGFTTNACIQMVPKTEINTPKLPINNQYVQVPVEMTIIDALALRDTSTHYGDAIPENVYDPVVAINNDTNDNGVKIVMGEGFMGTSGWVYGYSDDAQSKTIQSSRVYILGEGDFFLRGVLPKGAQLGVASSTASGSTTGTVTVKLYGWALRPTDFRVGI